MEINNAYHLITEKLQTWLQGLIKMLPNLALAVIILLLAVVAAKVIRNFSLRGMKKVSQKETINYLVATIIYVLVIVIGLFAALSVMDLEKTVTSLLAGAGLIGLALAFAFQDVASNFMSGLFLAFQRPIKEGDVIKTNGFMGTVDKVELRATIIRSFGGQRIIIPNKDVFQSSIVNYTSYGKRRVDTTCRVSYGDDLDKAEKVVLEAINSLPYVNENSNVDMYYSDFGDSSINMSVRFWIDYPGDPGYLKAKKDAIKVIKKHFDENDIRIPFPIRSLDFGVKDGEKLSDNMGQKPQN